MITKQKQQNNTNNSSNAKATVDRQDIEKQLDDLLEETKKLSQEIDKNNLEFQEAANQINLKFDNSLKKIKQTCAELVQIEKEAEAEFEKLALEELKTDEEKMADKKYKVSSSK